MGGVASTMRLAVACLALFAATGAKVVQFREVISASQTAGKTSVNLVYAPDQKSFEKAWENIGGTSARPPIDFAKEAAIIITAGEKPTSGYHIKVKGVAASKGTLVVDAVVTKPEPGTMTVPVLTSPYLVIAVPNAGVSAARWKNPPKSAKAPAAK
jgi:hypothetical protein